MSSLNRMRKGIVRGVVECFSVCTVVAASTAASLTAQSQFLRPTRPVDVTQYRTIEECSALMERLRDNANQHDPMSPSIDTFPIAVAERVRRTPWPAPLVQSAKTCAASFTPDQVALQDFDAFMPLFLQANRDEDAERLATRLLAAQPPFNGADADRIRAETISRIIKEFYAAARPARYATAVRLVTRELQTPTIATFPRVMLLTLAAENATSLDDTVQSKKWTELAMAEYQRTTAQSGVKFDENQLHFFKNVLGKRTRREMIDSLHRSTAAYVALRRTDPRFMEPVEPRSTAARIGDRAAPVKGDFWFAPNETSQAVTSPLVRPSPGKTSLMVFLSRECRRREDERSPIATVAPIMKGCFGTYAMLKRLLHRFPNVELTIAAQTSGSIWPAGPMEPAAEAESLRQWWLGFHKLPATLVVATTPFRRLDPPDRRRIDWASPNASTYNTETMAAVLVDRDGTIIERFSATRDQEPWLTELLTVLESRH